MSVALAYAANLVAITVLVFGLYFPRHHRRDLVVAYLGVNVGVMAVSTVLLGGHRRQLVQLDRAIADETALVAHLEQRLGADVQGVSVLKLDLVNDLTLVDVRYRVPGAHRSTWPDDISHVPATVSGVEPVR